MSTEHGQYTDIARRHFEKKGYRVHSGLQFGVELVLYAGVLCVSILFSLIRLCKQVTYNDSSFNQQMIPKEFIQTSVFMFLVLGKELIGG